MHLLEKLQRNTTT